MNAVRRVDGCARFWALCVVICRHETLGWSPGQSVQPDTVKNTYVGNWFWNGTGVLLYGCCFKTWRVLDAPRWIIGIQTAQVHEGTRILHSDALFIRQCSLKRIDFIVSGGRIIGPDEFEKMWMWQRLFFCYTFTCSRHNKHVYFQKKLRQLKYTGLSLMFRLLRAAIFRTFVSNKRMHFLLCFLNSSIQHLLGNYARWENFFSEIRMLNC